MGAGLLTPLTAPSLHLVLGSYRDTRPGQAPRTREAEPGRGREGERGEPEERIQQKAGESEAELMSR